MELWIWLGGLLLTVAAVGYFGIPDESDSFIANFQVPFYLLIANAIQVFFYV
ncbi:hypothetical protein ACJPQX_18180 [Vibrio vulnificus]|uniref:hypothetical protein n=1 Tax=Vibrio vulnificus TaxID=672 RepID=UPI003D9CAD5E